MGITRASLFELNDWPKIKCLLIVLVLQMFVWEVVLVDEFLYPLPIIRQVLVFLLLTFIPGYLVLRCLRLHELGAIESLLFAVGLSLFCLMSTGFILNLILPVLGFHTPITLFPLLSAVTFLILVLCGIVIVRDRDDQPEIDFHGKDLFSPTVLFLLLLPFLTIIGAYLVNFEQDTVLLWVVLLAVVVTVLLAGFDVISRKYLPLVIFVIGLVLLYHNSQISMYLTGSDIHEEYHWATFVIQQGIWDSNIPANVNSMLSIVMLSPIYSILTKIDPAWVFKIIYPFIFSLVPLGIYRVIEKQSGEKYGFFSVVLIFSVGTFFSLMLSLMRQMIAEFFLVLLLVLLVTSEMHPSKRDFLAVLFMAGLIVSHYGLAWMYILIFCLSAILIYLFKIFHNDNRYRRQFITVLFVSLYININLIWYMFMTASTLMNQLSNQYQTIYSRFYSSFFQVQQSQPAMLYEEGIITPLHMLSKYLHTFTLVLIAIGIGIAVIWLIFRRKPTWFSFNHEYTFIAFSNFILLAAGFVIPNLFMFSTTRVYQIVLILLAPFSLVGGIFLMRVFSRLFKFNWIGERNNQMRLFCLFFVFLFLFGSNLIYEAAGDHSDSISLSQKSIQENGSRQDLNNFYSVYFLEQELTAAQWLGFHRDANITVRGDATSIWMPLISYGGIMDAVELDPKISNDDSYVYLRFINLNYQIIGGPDDVNLFYNMSHIQPYLETKSVIYNDGKANVLK